MGAYLPCWSPAGRAPWLGDTSCVIRGTVGPPGTAVYSCVCDDFESIALQRCLDTCQWLVVNGWPVMTIVTALSFSAWGPMDCDKDPVYTPQTQPQSPGFGAVSGQVKMQAWRKYATITHAPVKSMYIHPP